MPTPEKPVRPHYARRHPADPLTPDGNRPMVTPIVHAVNYEYLDFEGDAGLAHQLLHKVYYRFKEHYGTVLCREVRAGAKGDCPEVCGRAAQWTTEVLLEEFAGYQPRP